MQRIEIFMAVKMQFVVLWVVLPCCVVAGYQRLGESSCLHLQVWILTQ